MITKIKQINGFDVDGGKISLKKITVRYANTKEGETLSLENGDILIGVDAAIVRKIIGDKSQKQGGHNEILH